MNADFWKKYPGLVWSNRQADDAVWIRAALLAPRFHTLLDIAVEFGRERLEAEWKVLEAEGERDALLAAPAVRRILSHIAEGFAQAGAGSRLSGAVRDRADNVDQVDNMGGVDGVDAVLRAEA